MTSIRGVLEVIRDLSNAYMQNLDRREDDWVVLTSPVYHDGSVNEHARDKVVMTLFNITRENIISSYTPARAGEDSFAILPPPLYIDLHIAFMANFASANYADGLGAISRLIAYFQQNPWFTQANAPRLPPNLDKITLEMSSYDPVEVNYVMSMLGTKYLPSVFYKLRMLPFTAGAMQARTYPARGAGVAEEEAATPASST
ncbi:DUF4255 domain-containing protein [Sphingomonas sp. CJ20]